MHRFYCPSQNISGGKIIITDRNQVHHLKDVLRIKIKDEVIIFDDRNNEYICVVGKLLDKVILDIKDRHFSYTPDIKISIACAIPKKSKMDGIVDKLTQLGVDKIIPLETERVVIKLDKPKKIARQERWRKIALSASGQSQRSGIPVIEPIKKIEEVLSHSSHYDLKLIPTLNGKRKNLKDIFLEAKPKNILVLIGPEGDFTPEEIDSAKKAGCIPVSLGDLVMRVDTAAVAVASFLRLYLYEDR
jgi:16S rRNA (uracil1498-N3)-methyltransferase